VEEFLNCFESFTQKLIDATKGIISIDGKTMRGSHDAKKGLKARHIVSAWSDSCKLVLGQEKVEDKSNEITAIPLLLKRLDLQGRIVTIDAMGCQRDICQQIINQGGDYVISLKGNKGNLHKDVALWFEDANHSPDHLWQEWDKGHGRIEDRECRATADIAWLQAVHNWPGLTSIAVVNSCRETSKGSPERRYYISSLVPNAEMIAKAARSHWGIENSLHWVLDVTMNEDKLRIRNENTPEILAIMRKWTLNMINKHKGDISVKRMLQKMAMSPKNLLLLLQKI
jgi:predicted transposase YbfD/YdcC